MSKKDSEFKTFMVRLPIERWVYLKHVAAVQQTYMNNIVVEGLDLYKKKYEKKLTPNGISV